MGSNRAGKNLRLKRKRHQKNLRTFAEAVDKRENPKKASPGASQKASVKKAASKKTQKAE